MDTSLLSSTIVILSHPAVNNFLSENGLDLVQLRFKLEIMKSTRFKGLPQEEKQAQIESMRLLAHKVANLMSKIVGPKAGSIMRDDLEKDWREITNLIDVMYTRSKYNLLLEDEALNDFSCDDIERIENMLLETEDCSNCETLNEEQSQVLLLKKAIPDAKHTPTEEQSVFLLIKIYLELGHLPFLICKACEEQPLALLLIGGLLSLKPMGYDTWNRVKDDMVMIKESNNCVTSNNMWHIINYCYDDLPNSLKLCFLYFACFPIGYEIPATSLTHIWLAEGFVTPEVVDWIEKELLTPEEAEQLELIEKILLSPEEEEWIEKGLVSPGKKETREEIANKFLEQLVQRSLVCVSKRSLLGTIKSFRLPRQVHEFAIQQSYKDFFMAANPDQEKVESLFRLAIHHDNNKQYTEVKTNHILSFLAFNFDNNVLESAVVLRVLELRKSTVPITILSNMIFLRYLGLRGCEICELPEDIGDMKDLQTLDVRDTSIQTLSESLWTISKLRHVYVNPSCQIKGPPSAAIIPNLHILKTVAAHESWQENIPKFLKNLRKFALSNWNNLDWKSISNLLSHTDNLITMAIIGNIIPSEFADIRAFPNLEKVKSIKLEGKWKYCRKLSIDNYKFPPNLTKLTLTNSGLTEDPMPALGRLQALKLLRLQDEAYIGNQMVCSANGFPQLQFLKLKKLENLVNWLVEPNAMSQLQFLKLKKLENLVNWVVEPNAMSQLTTPRVVQCEKLNYPSNLTVTSSDIDD